jgi:dihydropteroate synthase
MNDVWQVRGDRLDLSERALVMGVLNVTPDSFSDGGRYFDPASAIGHARDMIEAGADLIDIGGESTRPGADPVPVDEELRRVIPVVSEVAGMAGGLVSIDTTKAEVARRAVGAGAAIVNDVSGLGFDPDMAGVVAETGAGLVIMHMLGTPKTMQRNPVYADLLGEIAEFLAAALARAKEAGVEGDAVVLDPGIGFGKTFRHNWQILAGLGRLAALGRPLMVGTSRKRFLRELVGREAADLEAATLASSVAAVLAGARILRVHDVRSHVVAVRVAQRILDASP